MESLFTVAHLYTAGYILAGIILFFSLVKVVSQGEVYVISFLGKFSRIMNPGLNLKIPFLEAIDNVVSLRQQNFDVTGKFTSKDKVLIDIITNLIYRIRPDKTSLESYTYTLEDEKTSVKAILENSLRTYIAKEGYEGVLEKKEELADHIKKDLATQFNEWGMEIMSFQIVDMSFPKEITDAMSKVVASKQLMEAATNEGEALKIKAIKDAEGEKERKKLQGEGIALEREAIAKGLSDSIESMRKVTDQAPEEILGTLMMTQYLDTLKTIGNSTNAKVLFIDSSVQGSSNLMTQILTANEGKLQKIEKTTTTTKTKTTK